MKPLEQNAKFFDVPQEMFKTSVGNVELPILYYDVAQMCAYFAIDLDRAQKVLEPTG